MFAKYIRENRVSLDDIRALISSILVYDPDEIQAMLKDEKNKPPIGMILLLKAMMTDMNKGDLTNWEKLMDRVHGKPTNNVSIASGTKEIPDDPYERRALAESLRKELGIVQTPKPRPKSNSKEKEKNG